MADNQMVKIEFDFDLGNVPASAKKFAEYLKGIEGGSKEAQAQLKQLGNEIDKTSDKMNKSGDSIKKTNQQWTNFALVIQDLPYGFRGIQNNLPALVGGIAGMTGVIYFAASAVIALVTAWDMGIFKSKAATEAAKARTEELKKEKEATDNLYRSTAAEAIKVNELIAVLENENETRDRKKRAIKELQSLNPDVFKDIKLEGDKVNDLNSFYNKYIENLKNVILLKQYENDLEKIIQAELKTGKPIQEGKQKELKNSADLLKLNNDAIKDNISSAKILTYKDEKVIENINKYNIAQKQKIDLLDKIRKISPAVGLSAGGKDTTAKDQKSKEKAANEAATKSYLDTLDERAKKEYQAGLELADSLTKMQAAGFTDSTTYYAAYRANMDNIAKEYDDKEYKRNQDSINANIAAETKFHNDSERAWDAIQKKKSDTQTKYTKDRVDSLNLELKTELKLHKDSITLMQEDISNKIKQLELLKVFAFGNVQSIEIIDKAINNQKAQLKGLGDRWDSTAQQIKNTIEGVMTDVITQFASNIGKALAGEKVDLFGGIGDMIAEGAIAIGKSLIAYGVALEAFKLAAMDPALAIAAGAGLVIAGTFLKSKLAPKKDGGAMPFANGGIVSGPTMGLIGEYPGAKSNPEVVAPLDKLKDMLGGNGGGQFVLRGSDLVLALNRSETSLNLRRGA
jgi:hypothetical protein